MILKLPTTHLCEGRKGQFDLSDFPSDDVSKKVE